MHFDGKFYLFCLDSPQWCLLVYFELDPGIENNEDLKMLKEETHKFAEKVIRPAAEKIDKMKDPKKVIEKDSPYWHAMKELRKLDYHRIFLDSERGGLSLKPIEVYIILEELGWGSVGLTTALGVDQVPAAIASMFGVGPKIEEFVQSFADDKEGKIHGCWGVTEPDCASDYLMVCEENFARDHGKELHPGQVRIDKDGDDWVINGTKSMWISDAPVATHVGLHVTMPPHDNLANGAFCVVPLDQDGVTKGEPIAKLGLRDSPQGDIAFDNVRIPNEFMLVPQPFYQFRVGQILCVTSCLMATAFTGLARAAFEEALSYVKERVQGGKPLIEHQQVKQRLYGMFEKVETSRYYSRNVVEHVWKKIYVDKSFDASFSHAVAAQIYACKTSFEVANDALQLHGGYGLTPDYLVEKLFRDSRSSLIEDGSKDVLSLAVAYNIAAGYMV
jgi:alkylation response protein AidB-like acyl-CoA dehydrogenase